MKEIKPKINFSSVENALRILNCFTVEQPSKRVTDIAKELGLGKSTVSRLLRTLAKEGLAKKDIETQQYSLGLRILSLASILTSNLEVVREARPILQELVKETSESAQIAVLDGGRLIYVDQVKCMQPLRIQAHIGRINPIHCTSSGRLLLAYQNENKQQEFFENQLKKYTQFTTTNPVIIAEDFDKIKKQGYCILFNEFIEGVVSISAPVRDYKEKVIAAISLVGPIQRLNEEKINYYTKCVINAGKEISEKMGFMKKY